MQINSAFVDAPMSGKKIPKLGKWTYIGHEDQLKGKRMRIFPSAVLALSLSATAALSMDVAQNLTVEDIQSEYPYRILGLKPGMKYADIEAAAKERKIPLYAQGGTYGLTLGDKEASFNLDYEFNTLGYDNIYQYRDFESWDRIAGEISSPATSGGVVTYLNRDFKRPVSDGIKGEEIMAQVVATYGEPSFVKESESFWVHDENGVKLDVDPETIEGGCKIPSAGMKYIEAAEFEATTYCSVVFSVKAFSGRNGTNAYFKLKDIKLQMEDNAEISRQIDVELGSEIKPTNLDL